MEDTSSTVSNTQLVTVYADIPYGVISSEIEGTARTDFFEEIKEIRKLYKAYDFGEKFVSEGSNGDYIPSDLRFKKAAGIINKEARFLFAKSPDFVINQDEINSDEITDTLQNLLDRVLKKTNFNNKLLKACKDCFIGKRVACMLNFNKESGVSITFLNSMEFISFVSNDGSNTLQKIVTFSNTIQTTNRSEQRFHRKTYDMEKGVCYVEERMFDGFGEEIEVIIERQKTLFTVIPAVVIVNDGLTGEIKGRSELGYLLNYEKHYSKLANADEDAERKTMNPTKFAIDASTDSTKNLSSNPGSFWDIHSDVDIADGMTAQLGILEASMNYSTALKTTLDRIESNMFAEVDVPNIDNDKIQGVITSGKTLKALYWGLTVRCDEKMLEWQPALEFVVRTIIVGCKLYPEVAKLYSDNLIYDEEFEVMVINNYPLPEDEVEEKSMDLSEVDHMAMSRKSYLRKWRKLTDKEADAELKQIKIEQEMFENSVLIPEQKEDVEDSDEQDIDMQM